MKNNKIVLLLLLFVAYVYSTGVDCGTGENGQVLEDLELDENIESVSFSGHCQDGPHCIQSCSRFYPECKQTLAFNFNLSDNFYDRKSFNYACIWREAEDYNLPTSTSPDVQYLKEALTNYNPAMPFTKYIYGLDGIYDFYSVNKTKDPLVFGLSGIASFFVSLRRFRRLCQENPTWKSNIFEKFDQFLAGIKLGTYSVYEPVEYHDIKQQYDFTVYAFKQNPSFASDYTKFKNIISTLKQKFLNAYKNEEFNDELCNCQDIENFETRLNYESNSQFKAIMDQRRYVIKTVCGRLCKK